MCFQLNFHKHVRVFGFYVQNNRVTVLDQMYKFVNDFQILNYKPDTHFSLLFFTDVWNCLFVNKFVKHQLWSIKHTESDNERHFHRSFNLLHPKSNKFFIKSCTACFNCCLLPWYLHLFISLIFYWKGFCNVFPKKWIHKMNNNTYKNSP